MFLFMGSVRDSVGAAGRHAGVVGRAAIFMYAFGFSLNLLTILAIVFRSDWSWTMRSSLSKTLNVSVRGGETQYRRRCSVRVNWSAHHRDDDHAGGGVCPDRLSRWFDRVAVLEFAMTLAAAVVLSGVLAITLSPVMSSYFVHPEGKEGQVDQDGESGLRRHARRLWTSA